MTTSCARCGELIGCKPHRVGLAVCHSCRRAESETPVLEIECWWCGIGFESTLSTRKFCSIRCSTWSRWPGITISEKGTYRKARRSRRKEREQAPGLSSTERNALLQLWKRQGRRCTYCPALADSTDHVVPLLRGGTNYEGNLVPACVRCNGRKAGLLMIEFRRRRFIGYKVVG